MDSARAPFEPTTTLHLGVRSVADLSSQPLEAFLAQSSDAERAIFEEVLADQGNSAMVVIHRGPAKGARFLLSPTVTTVGRATSAEIFLDDVTVSRAHARFEKRDGAYHLVDAGSLNGSYVNNKSITDRQLKTGDEIQIGKFHLLFIGATEQVK